MFHLALFQNGDHYKINVTQTASVDYHYQESLPVYLQNNVEYMYTLIIIFINFAII